MMENQPRTPAAWMISLARPAPPNHAFGTDDDLAYFPVPSPVLGMGHFRLTLAGYSCQAPTPNVVCSHCGKTTRAPLPAEIAGHFGPQLAALIAYLTVVCRLPRRVVDVLLAQVLGMEISLGSTQKCWEEASQAVAAPCQELEQQLKD